MSELWFNYYPIDCDILCICGDIGNIYSDVFWSFINYVRSRAQYVLLVTGNHDYWGSNISQVDYDLREKLKELNNVFLLQKDTFIYKDYAFLGCTLWSHVPVRHWKQFENGFPDFSKIDYFSPLFMNMMHNDHKIWLTNTLERCKKQSLKPIVLTHYSPVFNISTSRKYRNNVTQHMFSTDMSELFPLVHTWAFGHTHYDVKGHMFRVKDHGDPSRIYPTVFITNQRCHPYRVSKHFDPKFIYDPGKEIIERPPTYSQNWQSQK
jgi:predicted phosphohydrolase